MKKIVIAGGSGFLGSVLARHFAEKTWEVVVLSRDSEAASRIARIRNWDGESLGPWIEELEGADLLINLCGRSVNCRYHRRNRSAILESRIRSTLVLKAALAAAANPPKTWLNASSATLYRHSHETPMDEAAGEVGDGFSVDVCRAWENALLEGELPKTRRVALRTSMVLGNGNNSVYPILKRIAKLGLGGKLSSGEQMVSWIHERDFARAVEFVADDDSFLGPVNVTAPAPVPNFLFMKALRDSLSVPFGLPHFRPLLELAAWLMRTETELTLKSRFVVPSKLMKSRFVFNFPFIDEAFDDLGNRARDAQFVPALLK